jgi:hypothetical protein
MLRVDEKSQSDAPRCALRAAAALIAGSIFAMSASAQAPAATTPAAATQHAGTPAALASKNAKPVMSPYARAAGQRERAGKAPAGHAPTMVQGLGKSHKSHTAAPSK